MTVARRGLQNSAATHRRDRRRRREFVEAAVTPVEPRRSVFEWQGVHESDF